LYCAELQLTKDSALNNSDCDKRSATDSDGGSHCRLV